MANPLEYVKAHPYIASGGVFVVGVILVLMFSGGSEPEQVAPQLGSSAPDYSGAAAANSMLVQSQLSAQVASLSLQSDVAMNADNNATAFKIAQKNFDVQNNLAVLSTSVSQATIDKDRTIGLSTIEAGRTVSLATIAGQVTINGQDNATKQYASLITKEIAGIQSTRDTSLATIAAKVQSSRDANNYLLGKQSLGNDLALGTHALTNANNVDYLLELARLNAAKAAAAVKTVATVKKPATVAATSSNATVVKNNPAPAAPVAASVPTPSQPVASPPPAPTQTPTTIISGGYTYLPGSQVLSPAGKAVGVGQAMVDSVKALTTAWLGTPAEKAAAVVGVKSAYTLQQEKLRAMKANK